MAGLQNAAKVGDEAELHALLAAGEAVDSRDKLNRTA
jgi:hypothetical protein